MQYDLSNELQRANFWTRAKALMDKGAIVELTEKKPHRTLAQNAYLHTILGYFGANFGYTRQEVKDLFFKCECNRDLFVRETTDRITGRRRIKLRSSSELTTAEMTLAIERFRDWSAKLPYPHSLYIPSPDEHRMVAQMAIEAEKAKQYL